MKLRKFQKDFLKGALTPGIDLAAMSLPRANGKSWLAGYILSRCLTPKDRLHVAGAEYLLCAASIEQARIVYRFVRSALEPTGEYRFLDATNRVGVTHPATNTRLRVISSNGKTAMGVVGCPLLVADEPGAWEVGGGTLLYDAIATALGKPESPMRAIFIGTLAPASEGWWHDLVASGTHGSTYVQALQGDRDKWADWKEIRRVNPLSVASPEMRDRLRVELAEAKSDSRLKARFLSYRLNIPTADESEMLLMPEDLQLMASRPVPARVGRPIVGIDLGAGRAWSAAVAVWQGGRIEATAVAPGIPSIEDQEKRDQVPAGTYRRLYNAGRLHVAEGLRVQPPAHLWDLICAKWGQPVMVICDRFRLNELRDAIGQGVNIEPRVSRWSEAAEDIRALRRLAKDGPFGIEPESYGLIATSLSGSLVKNDDAGNTRLSKKSANNEARDDVAAAMVLVAGAFVRQPAAPRRRARVTLV